VTAHAREIRIKTKHALIYDDFKNTPRRIAAHQIGSINISTSTNTKARLRHDVTRAALGHHPSFFDQTEYI